MDEKRELLQVKNVPVCVIVNVNVIVGVITSVSASSLLQFMEGRNIGGQVGGYVVDCPI